SVEPDKMIPDLRNPTLDETKQRMDLDLLQRLNQRFGTSFGEDAYLDGRIKAMETAFRMQSEAVDLFDVRKEPQTIREEYGETPVVWGGEFGRTPVSESGTGRDHNPYGYTMFIAGGGFKGGLAYGATDEFGFKAVENRVSIHDLHATMLNQLGMDHTKLTYRYAGRDFRLTDVYGEVVNDLLM